MPTLHVDGQEFRFAAGWQAVVYDQDPFRREHFGEREAVDIVALDALGRLFLFEAKDYRGSQRARAHGAAIRHGQLLDLLAEKVRWSVFGLLIAGTRHREAGAALLPFADALRRPDLDVRVVAWIEHSLPQRSPALEQLNYLRPGLQKKLRWLKCQSLLVNSQTARSIPGLEVQDVVGARVGAG